ncbi:carbohydrate ABC transporter permease [Bradyrhizobium erythrophlei]|uniref:Maltose/maltodextrin transport system permease protein MalG n=1 Tax=Bradyrhizobium erythrophlei TaxID=1437360 RepID=A0A1M5GXN1_9BRAD|nr:carbohydrate ABC transporter permease [Bradyrhizobium erythrophlei]SHG08490.1 carbohydrate ABC transporter membrane protein 2, CUT1 family [Bradyrhizobium erythrophlei]
MNSRARNEAIPIYLALALILLFFALPLFWLLSLSIRTPAEILIAEVRIVPHSPTLQNFVEVLGNQQFLGYLWNGVTLSVVGAACACVAAAPASYAFSRLKFPGKTQLLFAVLGFQMISPLVIMLPLYRYMHALGLTESHLGAALVYAAVAAPIATWTLKGSFDAIPEELEEAAMIDGCTRSQAFLRITLPIGLPGLASTFILTTMLGWSQFIVPFILLSQPDMLPISVGIFNFLGAYTGSATQLVAAASVLSLLPAVVIFLFFQKFVVGALTAGALKE